jgi:hypothetical protein
MKRLHALRLDHARAQPRCLRLPALLLAGAACVAAALLADALQLAASAAQLEDQVRQRARGDGGAALARAAPRASAEVLAERRLAARIQAELGMPWERLFGALEQASGPDIGLLTMAPQPAQAELNLDGEARNMAALLEFMRRLQGGGFFSAVYLRGHHVDPADEMHAVRFSLRLQWGRA